MFPIVWDDRGQIWKIGSVSIRAGKGWFLFFRLVSDFCSGLRSFSANKKSNLHRWREGGEGGKKIQNRVILKIVGENGKKTTTTDVISKKNNFARAAHFFL